MDSNQNKLESVKIGISLSQNLITASLGLLTILGGAIIYLVKEEKVNFYAYATLGLSLLALLISIRFGYFGISRARNNGFRGWWSITAGERDFNAQTNFCILAIFLFLMTPVVILCSPGNKKSDDQISIQNNISIKFVSSIGPFETGNYQVTEEMKNQIISNISEIRKSKLIVIIGSADKRELRGLLKGNIGSNLELATLRAEMIKKFLENQGIPGSKMFSLINGGINKDSSLFKDDRLVKIYSTTNENIANFIKE